MVSLTPSFFDVESNSKDENYKKQDIGSIHDEKSQLNLGSNNQLQSTGFFPIKNHSYYPGNGSQKIIVNNNTSMK